jgi:hypothetical protein
MWGEVSILEQLPNGGAVVAVITVVYVFLRHQEKSNETLKAIVETFTKELSSARTDYREHIGEIMDKGLDAHRETRETIRGLTPVKDRNPAPDALMKGRT